MAQEYLWQFDVIKELLQEQHAQKKDLEIKLHQNQGALTKWKEEKSAMHKRQSGGEQIPNYAWDRLEKECEEINLLRPRIELGLERVQFTIETTQERLFGFYDEIVSDYHRNLLTSEKYKKYLSHFKEMINVSNVFSHIISQVIVRIKKDISIFTIA